MRIPLFLLLLSIVDVAAGQTNKKPLDPSVYDGWQNIGERLLSPDGKYLVYTVTPQEGDGRLFIRSTTGSYAKEIPRGATAAFTADNRFVVFHIRPLFKDIREARIKKKTPDQMPKDSLAWIELGTDSVTKIPRVRSFKIPEDQGAWLAYLLEKPASPPQAGVAGKWIPSPASALTGTRRQLVPSSRQPPQTGCGNKRQRMACHSARLQKRKDMLRARLSKKARILSSVISLPVNKRSLP